MSNQWKLVPVEPTDEMQEAVRDAWESEGAISAKQMYKAMLAAAPEKQIDTKALRGLLKHLEASRELYADVTRNAAVSHPGDANRLAEFDRQIAALKEVISC
ncbi:hypothetical protein D3C77_48940 [compost metagenome]